MLGRCLKCGSLMHFSCVIPESPGAEHKCPVCHREVEDDGEAYPYLLDVGAPKARRTAARGGAATVSGEAPKEVPPPTLSVEALPARMVFPVGKSPTDAEAQALGFPTAKEWYVQTSTAFRHGQPAVRPALEAEFSAMRAPEEPGENRSQTRALSTTSQTPASRVKPMSLCSSAASPFPVRRVRGGEAGLKNMTTTTASF